VLSSIPSPSFNQIGPFRLYGLIIALGVLAAVWLAQKRYAARGGNPEDVSNIALWAVPAGLIGARLYHVITDWQKLYSGGRWWPDALQIWHGGLGIPGGIIGGTLVGYIYVRRKGLPAQILLDVGAPCIPLAQAIGRFGNYFNQELFGRPTSLPWGLRIDPEFRPARYISESTFHPTFLYEALWSLGVVGVLLAIDRTHKLRNGKLFPLYLGGYFLGRMWVEELRSDPAAQIGGLRWNFVFSIIMVVASAVWFFWQGPFRKEGDPPPYVVADPEADGTGLANSGPIGSGDDLGDDGVGEPRPDVEGPGAELVGAERDQGEAEVRVDPEEGA
jgi:prolipoprotein diacylglyceryl transferase